MDGRTDGQMGRARVMVIDLGVILCILPRKAGRGLGLGRCFV